MSLLAHLVITLPFSTMLYTGVDLSKLLHCVHRDTESLHYRCWLHRAVGCVAASRRPMPVGYLVKRARKIKSRIGYKIPSESTRRHLIHCVSNNIYVTLRTLSFSTGVDHQAAKYATKAVENVSKRSCCSDRHMSFLPSV